MAQGDFFEKTEVVEGGDSLVVDGSGASTGAVELHTFASEGAVRVQKESDVDGDGVYDVSAEIEDTEDAIHSQKNKIEVSSSKNMRVRVENKEEDSRGIHITGIEVND